MSRVRWSCSSWLMASGWRTATGGFASTVEVLRAKGTAGPPSGGGDGFAREASAGTSDRPARRACGRARGRWNVRLEVGAGGGGSGPGWRHPPRTPAAGAAEGGLGGPGADVGARAAGGSATSCRPTSGPPGAAAEVGVPGGPARPGLSHRPPAQACRRRRVPVPGREDLEHGPPAVRVGRLKGAETRTAERPLPSTAWRIYLAVVDFPSTGQRATAGGGAAAAVVVSPCARPRRPRSVAHPDPVGRPLRVVEARPRGG